MKMEVRALTPKMQKFRDPIQAYNVCISFVRCVHNAALDEMWEAAKKYDGYQRAAETIDSKRARQVIKSLKHQSQSKQVYRRTQCQ